MFRSAVAEAYTEVFMTEIKKSSQSDAPQQPKNEYAPPRAVVRQGKGERMFSRAIPILVVILIASLVAMLALLTVLSKRTATISEIRAEIEADNAYMQSLLALADAHSTEVSPIDEPKIDRAVYAKDSKVIDGIGSKYAILIDTDSHTVVASRGGEEKIYPASMTKLMTLIVAVEHIADFNDTYTFTYQIINPPTLAGASVAGFSVGETVPLIDLLYGTALPSGADATSALADYIAGSEEVFAELMNEKAEMMGLDSTHFVNASGLHNSDHYSTPHEMALILEYALEIPLLRDVLSTYQYTTTPTEHHPSGLLLTSTLFSRMYGDEPEVAEVFAGKTGYTIEAKNCLASAAKTEDGRTYILVTAYADGSYAPIYDAIDVYKKYIPTLAEAAQ